MLFNLAENGDAPKKLGEVTKNGIPGFAVICSAVVLLIGVLLNYVVPAISFEREFVKIGSFPDSKQDCLCVILQGIDTINESLFNGMLKLIG